MAMKGPKRYKNARRTRRSAKRKPNMWRLRGYKTKRGNQNPFPTSFSTVMKYADSYSLTLASPMQTFNLNGLFDPDNSGLGHQPLGFDQLCPTLYTRYRVWKVNYVIIASPPTVGGAGTAGMIAVRANNSAMPIPPNIGNWAEKPRTQVKTVSVSGDPQIITGSVNLAELNGKSFAQYITDDITAGTSAANPSEIQHLGICAFDQDGTGINLSSMKIQVVLEYHVTFFDPVVPPQS